MGRRLLLRLMGSQYPQGIHTRCEENAASLLQVLNACNIRTTDDRVYCDMASSLWARGKYHLSNGIH